MNTIFEETQVKYLERGGVKLAYRYFQGKQANASALVFVHGWAGSAADWQILRQHYIEQGQSVLIYDAAGFGQSQFDSELVAKTADYSLGRYAEDLKALLDAEGIERARLVGHSWGGVVAMCFAERYPERTEKLVAIGSAYFDSQNLLHQILKWASYLIALIIVLGKPVLQRSSKLRQISVKRYFLKPPDAATAELVMQDVLESNNRAIIQTLLTGYEVRFKQTCPAIQCPTLYLGSKEDIVAPLPYVKAFVPLTPHASSITLPSCGHFPMLEIPTDLVSVLDNFFTSVNPGLLK